jgi:hypothetical protein
VIVFNFKMKLLLIFVLFAALQLSSTERSSTQLSSSKDVGEVVSLIVTSDWLKTMANKVDPVLGVILEGISLILSLFTESEAARMERFFRQILDKLDEMDSRLDQIENSVS